MADGGEHPIAVLRRHGMQFYREYRRAGYQFKIYVPTTIFNPLAAEVRVYKVGDPYKQLPEQLAADDRVLLYTMPWWETESCALRISVRDERELEKRLSQLERKILK